MTNDDMHWHAKETYRSMITYGQGMLKFTFLVNGAAIISILTFLGHAYSKPGTFPSMKLPMVLFVIGLLLSGAAGITAYLVQFMLFNETIRSNPTARLRSHMFWVYVTFIFIFGSLIAFGFGAFDAAIKLQ